MQESFETMSVNFKVESLNGQTKLDINTFVLDNVTGTLEVVDWKKMSQKWNHLKGRQFPQVGMNKKVDMLIGLDYANLHSALYEVHGNVGEPIARLTPLGWTCIGNTDKDTHTSLFSTYFVNQTSELDELTKEFWAMDSYGTQKHEKDLTPVKTRVLKQTTESIKCENNHYEVGIPWKESKREISNNYEMTEKGYRNLMAN